MINLKVKQVFTSSEHFCCGTTKHYNKTRARKKNPSGHPGQVDFPLGQVTFSPYLPHGQEPRQAVRQLNFWSWFWEERVNFRPKGNQVFRWSLTKITIYSAVLLIVWCALMAQKWLPSTWSKSATIKFLSRIKNSSVGHKNAACIS